MANFIRPVDNLAASSLKLKPTLDKYADLGDFIDQVNKPDNREKLVEVYGDQMIGGPLGLTDLVGAVKVQSYNDEVQYWEAPRLHKTQSGSIGSTSPNDTGAKTITTTTDHTIVTGDVVQIDGDIIARATSTGDKTYTVIPYLPWGRTFSGGQFVEVSKIGSEFAQGTNMPTSGELSNLVRRTNKHMISKYIYKFTGSQAGNIGWVEYNGQYYWHLKGAEDQRKRAENYLESQALFARIAENSNLTGSSINGSEGYVDAIEDRGIIKNGYITDLSDLEELVVIMNKQRGVSDYMFFTNTQQQLFFDRLVANATGSVGQPNYGVFNNDSEMAVKLGFKSAQVGGINFHCKPIQVLIDPKFGGLTDFYKGFMTPMDTVTDKDGIQAPMLEKNVKGYPSGKLRYMEHSMKSNIDGIYTGDDGEDSRTLRWLSEYCVIARGANAHVLVKG